VSCRPLRLRGHVRQLVADHLELADRLAELRPLLRVAERRLQGRLRHAHRPRSRLDARDLVRRHQLVEAFTGRPAEQVLRRHLVPVELQRVRVHPLVPDGGDLAPRQLRRMEVVPGRLGDEQDGDPVVLLGRLRIGDHRGAQDVRLVGPGAPRLLAGHGVVIAVEHGAALDPRRVAARVGLGERRRGEDLPRAESGEELLLLLLVPAACTREAVMIIRVITEPTDSQALDSSSATMAMESTSRPLPP